MGLQIYCSNDDDDDECDSICYLLGISEWGGMQLLWPTYIWNGDQNYLASNQVTDCT